MIYARDMCRHSSQFTFNGVFIVEVVWKPSYTITNGTKNNSLIRTLVGHWVSVTVQTVWLARISLFRANSFAFAFRHQSQTHDIYHSSYKPANIIIYQMCLFCLQWKSRLMHLGSYNGSPFKNLEILVLKQFS